MTTSDEICRMKATELTGRIRNRELSPVEVVDAVLERMEKLEPTFHAFCTPTPDLARDERGGWSGRSPRAETRGLWPAFRSASRTCTP